MNFKIALFGVFLIISVFFANFETIGIEESYFAQKYGAFFRFFGIMLFLINLYYIFVEFFNIMFLLNERNPDIKKFINPSFAFIIVLVFLFNLMLYFQENLLRDAMIFMGFSNILTEIYASRDFLYIMIGLFSIKIFLILIRKNNNAKF
jgi:hypothetical protein